MGDLAPSEFEGYGAFLEQIKQRVQSAQLTAARSVNAELVLLYWHIGREILQRQVAHGWGAKVIDRLADDLKRTFPEMRGFSPRNLKYMRALATAYPDDRFVQQVVAQIPWGHNVRILDTVKSATEREFYLKGTLPRMVPQCLRTPNTAPATCETGTSSHQLFPDIAAISI